MAELPEPLIPAEPLTRAQSDAVARTRRGRNIAMLCILLGLAALFYALAFIKLPGH